MNSAVGAFGFELGQAPSSYEAVLDGFVGGAIVGGGERRGYHHDKERHCTQGKQVFHVPSFRESKSAREAVAGQTEVWPLQGVGFMWGLKVRPRKARQDRKSTRLNS